MRSHIFVISEPVLILTVFWRRFLPICRTLGGSVRIRSSSLSQSIWGDDGPGRGGSCRSDRPNGVLPWDGAGPARPDFFLVGRRCDMITTVIWKKFSKWLFHKCFIMIANLIQITDQRTKIFQKISTITKVSKVIVITIAIIDVSSIDSANTMMMWLAQGKSPNTHSSTLTRKIEYVQSAKPQFDRNRSDESHLS